MTEYFRITGLNNINFDQAIAGPYRLTGGSPPVGMSEPLSREEVLGILPRLPLGIRPHVLEHGLSIITCQINIQAGTDTLMEQYRHDLTETLEDAALYIETRKERGTRAVLRYKMDNVAPGNDSYKTIFYGTVDELAGRDVLGAKVKESLLQDMKLTLYCEPYWRPEEAITLGPNEIYCPSFEENADSGAPNELADNWTLVATPTPTWESTIVLHGCYSQKLVTDAVNEGVESTAFPSGATNRTAVAYAWIHRSAGGEIRVQMREGGVTRAEALFSTAGWETATGKDGASTWYRVVISGTMPNNANHTLRIIADDAATTLYVDKCYWEWDTLICPDEWISHRLLYNHYDAPWLPNKPGGAGAGDVGHINYVGVDDLKGDVGARLQLAVEFEKVADQPAARDLIVARRTVIDPCQLFWWKEAEDRTAASNWANAGGVIRCSAGECVTDAANATGYIRWNIATDAEIKGAFDVFGVFYTTDIANTRYRLSYSLGGVRAYEKWVWQPTASKWQLIRLGSIHMDHFLRFGNTYPMIIVDVEYAKDPGGDIAKLDCIWLIPKDEPEMWLDSGADSLTLGGLWVFSQIEDFDYWGHEDTPAQASFGLALKGQFLSLAPMLENRLFFVCTTDDGTVNVYEAHDLATGPADALEMIVNIDYLPQYISPIE